MPKNNASNQEPRGTKRVRIDQEEGNSQVDIEEDIEEEVPTEENPIQEVKEKPSLDLFVLLGDQDLYIEALGDIDWVASDSTEEIF